MLLYFCCFYSQYDFIHVTPPMAPVTALRTSPLVDATGFVEVDAETCQHVKYPNVFSLGDSSNLAVSKTAAAVGAQSEVVRQNLTSLVKGKELKAKVMQSYTINKLSLLVFIIY